MRWAWRGLLDLVERLHSLLPLGRLQHQDPARGRDMEWKGGWGDPADDAAPAQAAPQGTPDTAA